MKTIFNLVMVQVSLIIMSFDFVGLRPNATCVKDIVREAVQDALRKSQRLPSDSSFQGRAIRDFVDALRRLIRSL